MTANLQSSTETSTFSEQRYLSNREHRVSPNKRSHLTIIKIPKQPLQAEGLAPLSEGRSPGKTVAYITKP